MLLLKDGKKKVFTEYDVDSDAWFVMVKFVRSGVCSEALTMTDVFYKFVQTFSTKAEAETWIREHYEEIV